MAVDLVGGHLQGVEQGDAVALREGIQDRWREVVGDGARGAELAAAVLADVGEGHGG